MRSKDLLLMALTMAGSILMLIPLIWILWEEVRNGIPVILDRGLGFLIEPPPMPGGGIGGIGTVLQGTLVMVGLGSLIGGPIGFLSGFYIYEFPGSRLAGIGRAVIEAMVEFPTIIVGIAVFLLLVIPMGRLSTLAGAVSLAIIMIPYVAIQVIESLKALPPTIREGAYALGLSRWDVMKVVAGAAKSGLITAILIGVAKIAGETAPLLFTTTTTFNAPFRSFAEPVGAIPVLIYTFAFSPYENWHANAWGAALILTLLILAIYVPTRIYAWKG